jgi:O-acetyl-ADP-ribose deacetylase (regulator of RNase III)
MITRVERGDLFRSKAQTLVNTVNTVGVMGKGIALMFKKRFPDMYEEYVARCESGAVRLGEPYLYRTLLPPWVINFPTKEHWRAASRLDAIVDGLAYLARHVDDWGIESLAVPPLGCGNGQLDWEIVGPTLFRALDELPFPVELYAPHDADPQTVTRTFLADQRSPSPAPVPRVSAAQVAVAVIVERLTAERYAWPVGHTRFQKLCYFATAAGIPLGLEFDERPYGPFASGLKRDFARLVNNGLLTEQSSGRYQLVTVGRTFEDARKRFADELSMYDGAIQHVTDLMLRLPPRRTELAATVHFAAQALTMRTGVNPSDEAVIAEVRRWKKTKFDRDEVLAALGSLEMLGWLTLAETGAIAELNNDAVSVA